MSKSVITLNVGGVLYTTTRSTLERAPFIDALLRNKEAMGNPEFEGNPFIDRSGEAFKDILAFLRSGLPVAPSIPVTTLQQEANFYGINGFQVLSAPKKLFLPESTTSEETIRGVWHDRTRRGEKRYHFDIDNLPAGIPSHIGSRGVTGCVTKKDLAQSGFRLVEVPPAEDAKPSCGQEGDVTHHDENSRIQAEMDKELVFRRVKTTHFVDLEEFSVPDDGSTWDIVETKQFHAVVTKYR